MSTYGHLHTKTLDNTSKKVVVMNVFKEQKNNLQRHLLNINYGSLLICSNFNIPVTSQ